MTDRVEEVMDKIAPSLSSLLREALAAIEKAEQKIMMAEEVAGPRRDNVGNLAYDVELMLREDMAHVANRQAPPPRPGQEEAGTGGG